LYKCTHVCLYIQCMYVCMDAAFIVGAVEIHASVWCIMSKLNPEDPRRNYITPNRVIEPGDIQFTDEPHIHRKQAYTDHSRKSNPTIRNITDILIDFEILQRNTTTGPTTTAHEELDTARTVISRQTKAIAIRNQKIERQHIEIESEHKARIKAEEALSHAEDKTEDAHTKWIECKEKLGVAKMERGLTYLVLAGNRRIACPACDRQSITVSELIEQNIKLVGNRFGEMR